MKDQTKVKSNDTEGQANKKSKYATPGLRLRRGLRRRWLGAGTTSPLSVKIAGQ